MALSKTIQDKRRFPDVNEDDIEGMLKPKLKKNTEKSTQRQKSMFYERSTHMWKMAANIY